MSSSNVAQNVAATISAALLSNLPLNNLHNISDLAKISENVKIEDFSDVVNDEKIKPGKL